MNGAGRTNGAGRSFFHAATKHCPYGRRGGKLVPMYAQLMATIRGAAGRHPVNAFRAHHFAGLGCCAR
jgi:hypothetical protein